jgi:anti-sigma regulatory factor (Ser/Thr protein kinase)
MITLAVVSLDPYTGRMAYSCVGHPPPLLLDRSSGQVTRLDGASAPPMGVAGPADVIEAVLPLPEAAVLVLYTDGLVERRGQDIDRTIDVLGALIADEPGASPAALLTKVGTAIGPTDDDVALLVASIALEQLTFEMEINSDPKMLGGMRRRLEAWLMHREVEEADVVDVILSVSEACNNAIEHAYRDNGSGPVDIAVAREGDALRIVVEDHGLWRDQRSSDERGRGLMLIRRLMHSTAIETGLHGTRVTFTRRLRAGQQNTEEYASAAPGVP